MAAGLMVGYLAMLLFRPARLKYMVSCEYWVYLPTEKAPTQDEIMAKMVRDCPYTVHGQPAIGPREGLVFSDIRLHAGLILRSKNPHVFRPDLFDTHVQPTAADLADLAESPALLKVRFASEEPLRDDRYLQFLPHMALAVADLAKSDLIFDTVGQRLIRTDWLRSEMERDADATRPDLHIRVVWSASGSQGIAETKGLPKIGLPEIVTEPATADQQVLLTTLLEAAAAQVWDARAMPLKLFVEAYQDMFELQLTPPGRGPCKARVFRARGV